MSKTPVKTLHAWFESARDLKSSTPKDNERTKREHSLVSQASSDCSMDIKRAAVQIENSPETRIESKLDTMHKALMDKLNEVQNDISNLSNKVESLEKQTGENTESIQKNKSDIESLKQSLEFAHSEIADLKKVKARPSGPTAGISKAQRKELDKQKAYSGRHNIIYEGVQHERNEDCVLKIDNINSDFLGLPGARYEIDKAHRTGPIKGNKPRDIIVRFKSHWAADITYEKRKMLKGSGIWIKRDVPPRLEREMKTMEKVIQIAKDADRKARIVQGNKLLFNGKIYESENLQETKLPLYTAHQKETAKGIFFRGHLSPLSNFYSSPLVIDNICFNSVEQYYQAEKARRHGDQQTFMAIMEEYDTAQIKNFAKKIKRKDEITAEEDGRADEDNMLRALEIKFTDQRLKEFLIQTGDRPLAEATFDDKWGTGIDFYNPRCGKSEYQGRNKLGKMLMKVRAELNNS